jgi:hypothetical protein
MSQNTSDVFTLACTPSIIPSPIMSSIMSQHSSAVQNDTTTCMMIITKGFVTSQNEKIIGGKRNTEVLPKQCLKIKNIRQSVLNSVFIRVRLMVEKSKDHPTCVQVLEDKKVTPYEEASVPDRSDHMNIDAENTVPNTPPVNEEVDGYLHMTDDQNDSSSSSSPLPSGSEPAAINQAAPVVSDNLTDFDMEFTKLCVKHSTHICGGYFFLRFELYTPAASAHTITTIDGGQFQTITKRGLLKRGEKMKRKDLRECCISSISPSVSVTHGHQLIKIAVDNMPQNVDLTKVQISFGPYIVQHVYSAQNGSIVVESSECQEGSYDVIVSLDGGKTNLISSSSGSSAVKTEDNVQKSVTCNSDLKMTFVSFDTLKDMMSRMEGPFSAQPSSSSTIPQLSSESAASRVASPTRITTTTSHKSKVQKKKTSTSTVNKKKR